MIEQTKYEVLLIPGMKVAVRDCTLREAAAWIREYNTIHERTVRHAVISNRPQERSAA